MPGSISIIWPFRANVLYEYKLQLAEKTSMIAPLNNSNNL